MGHEVPPRGQFCSGGTTEELGAGGGLGQERGPSLPAASRAPSLPPAAPLRGLAVGPRAGRGLLRWCPHSKGAPRLFAPG